jgi:hypothetical protein
MLCAPKPIPYVGFLFRCYSDPIIKPARPGRVDHLKIIVFGPNGAIITAPPV